MKIPLHNQTGEIVAHALVDDEDFPVLNEYSWHKTKHGYVARARVREERKKSANMILMHRQIMRAKQGEVVDHINGDKLDNRTENLRIATIAQNNWNSKIRRHNRAGYKGVSKHARSGLYVAQIVANGAYWHLGYYETAVEAAAAYKAGSILLHGEYAPKYYNKVP